MSTNGIKAAVTCVIFLLTQAMQQYVLMLQCEQYSRTGTMTFASIVSRVVSS